MFFNLLVVEDDVWSPYVVGRNVQLFDTPILVGVPHQFVVIPKLKRKKERTNIIRMTIWKLDSWVKLFNNGTYG